MSKMDRIQCCSSSTSELVKSGAGHFNDGIITQPHRAAGVASRTFPGQIVPLRSNGLCINRRTLCIYPANGTRYVQAAKWLTKSSAVDNYHEGNIAGISTSDADPSSNVAKQADRFPLNRQARQLARVILATENCFPVLATMRTFFSNSRGILSRSRVFGHRSCNRLLLHFSIRLLATTLTLVEGNCSGLFI